MVSEEPTDRAALRARSYADVARSSSTLPSRERASARRWTKAELDARIAAAPGFAYESPSPELLVSLVTAYHELTGELLRTHGQRNLLAAGYRMHGTNLVPFLKDVYVAQGSSLNLLGIVRCARRRGEAGPDGPSASRLAPTGAVVWLPVHEPANHEGPPCPVDACLASLIYCDDHRPPFDATSTRRYDRRNPEPASNATNSRHVGLGAFDAGAGR